MDKFGRGPGPVPVESEVYQRTYRPKTDLGAMIRAEFAKRGWKVGDVAKMLGLHCSRVSEVINQCAARRGDTTRHWSDEERISRLLGFDPFPPRILWEKYDSPLAQELFQVTRMHLKEIAKRWGLPWPRFYEVCTHDLRDERIEPLIERLLGRKVFDGRRKRKPSPKNQILAELQKRGFTLEYVAQEVGITRERVRQVCNGFDTLGRAARSPNIEAKVTELLGYDPFPALNRPERKTARLAGWTAEQKLARQREQHRAWVQRQKERNPPKPKPRKSKYVVFGLDP